MSVTVLQCFILLALTLFTACGRKSPNVALGTLERDRIAHTATVNEVIVALPIEQGSVVAKGDLLVQLDDIFQKAQVSRAEADVAYAEATLEKLQNGERPEDVAAASAKVAGAKAIYKESTSFYARSLDLSQRKALSDADLERAEANRDASLASLQSAEKELLKLTDGTRVEDLRAGEASLESVRAVLASEKKKLADLSIIATRDGILDNLPWNLGERVTAGSPLAIVLAGKAPFARIYVPEPYRVKVKVGDSLLVRVDGLENPITGTVRWIATDPAFTPYYALNKEERSRLMYLAEVQLPDSEAQLPNGLPAQVELP